MQFIPKVLSLFKVLIPEICTLCAKDSSAPICHDCETRLKIEIKIHKSFGCIPVYSFIKYSEKRLQKWLYTIKFEGNIRAAHQLAEFLKQHVELDELHHFDIAIPVPIHERKKRLRGFNQVDVIMKKWIELHGVTYLDVLSRKKHTKPLFDLSVKERQYELKDAFEFNSIYTPELLSDKTVCLVDDIYTTGATVSALVSLLETYGVKQVSVVTIARA